MNVKIFRITFLHFAVELCVCKLNVKEKVLPFQSEFV